MNNNSNYKENTALLAQKHHELMEQKYLVETNSSVLRTEFWAEEKIRKVETTGNPVIVVDNVDTVTGLFKYAEGKTVVLNFASYKHPGGGFINGSMAQEEALCHESNLYEILSDANNVRFYKTNRYNQNKALYKNRGLYSPDVVFEREGKIIKADVLTVAAPNRSAYMSYASDANEEENKKELASRIKFVSDVIKLHRLNTAILGAYGCGVFGQDPADVAYMFKKNLNDCDIKTVYAVIDRKKTDGNFSVFERIMKGA